MKSLALGLQDAYFHLLDLFLLFKLWCEVAQARWSQADEELYSELSGQKIPLQWAPFLRAVCEDGAAESWENGLKGKKRTEDGEIGR